MINKNTSLMQLISIYFTLVSLYMFRAGHCPSSGEHDTVHISRTCRTCHTVPPVYFRRLSSPTTQHLQILNIFYPFDASSASFNGLIPITDMHSFMFS